MGLGIFFGFAWSATLIIGALLGGLDSIPHAYRGPWIGVPVTPVLASVLAYGAAMTSFLPRMVFGCLVLLAPGALVTAIICLATEQAPFALLMAAWILAIVLAWWIASRIANRMYVRGMMKAAALEAEVARVKCPGCGQVVQALSGACPWRGHALSDSFGIR